MNEMSFTKEYIEEQCTLALKQWGYDCEVKVESEDILCITVFSREGVDLDSKFQKFRFCRTPELTMSDSRHRKNYYFWQDGLVKFQSESFWLTRSHGLPVRGAFTEEERAHCRNYFHSHREERRQYQADYAAAHRDEILQKKDDYYTSRREEILQKQADYYATHRDERLQYSAARNSQLWSNGTETLKWSTLVSRGRKLGLYKQDLVDAGWKPVD